VTQRSGDNNTNATHQAYVGERYNILPNTCQADVGRGWEHRQSVKAADGISYAAQTRIYYV